MVWDLERQHSLGQLQGHDDTITAVAARGSLAVSCQNSGPVRTRVWNLATMRCTATVPTRGSDATVTAACCMDGGKVLLGQDDYTIKLWNVSASALVALADLEGHTSEVNDVKAAAAGSMVLSGSDDNTVRLWDLRTSSRCVRTMEGHSGFVWSVDMDGQCRTAVSGSGDKTVKLWDLGSGRCTKTYECPGNEALDVVMHESGSSFLSSGLRDGIVNAWAVGSTRATMRADMAPYVVPNARFNHLFASKDLSTVTFCSMGSGQLRLAVWR